jgi:putative DNA primase/helicase
VDYYVTTSAWKEEVCRGFDSKRLAATLAQRGLLDAPDTTRRAKFLTVPGHGKLRLYHVLSALMEGGNDA